MKTVILFLGGSFEKSVEYCIKYIGTRFCETSTFDGLVINTILTQTEKEDLTDSLINLFDTTPAFIEATQEEMDSVKKVLTLKIKQ